jgi:hypothetical protein
VVFVTRSTLDHSSCPLVRHPYRSSDSRLDPPDVIIRLRRSSVLSPSDPRDLGTFCCRIARPANMIIRHLLAVRVRESCLLHAV